MKKIILLRDLEGKKEKEIRTRLLDKYRVNKDILDKLEIVMADEYTYLNHCEFTFVFKEGHRYLVIKSGSHNKIGRPMIPQYTRISDLPKEIVKLLQDKDV